MVDRGGEARRVFPGDEGVVCDQQSVWHYVSGVVRLVAKHLRQHRGFRGMFPRSSRKQTAEANEDNMASRLQLELGKFLCLFLLIAVLKRVLIRSRCTYT